MTPTLNRAPEPLEFHAVGVVAGAEACLSSCRELLELGVPPEDLGVVLTGKAAELLAADRLDGRLSALEPIAAGALVASRGYPLDVISDARSAGDAALPFGALLSERDGAALGESIAMFGTSVWARTRESSAADQIAELLLSVSSARVRTFARPVHQATDGNDCVA